MNKKITKAAWEALHSVLELCMTISQLTKADCFFEYTPHTNGFSVHYYRDGWVEGAEPEWLAMSTDINEENLQKTIKQLIDLLVELAKEAENG